MSCLPRIPCSRLKSSLDLFPDFKVLQEHKRVKPGSSVHGSLSIRTAHHHLFMSLLQLEFLLSLRLCDQLHLLGDIPRFLAHHHADVSLVGLVIIIIIAVSFRGRIISVTCAVFRV